MIECILWSIQTFRYYSCKEMSSSAKYVFLYFRLVGTAGYLDIMFINHFLDHTKGIYNYWDIVNFKVPHFSILIYRFLNLLISLYSLTYLCVLIYQSKAMFSFIAFDYYIWSVVLYFLSVWIAKYLNIFDSLELFTPALADCFSLESEWQQVSSSLQDSS